MRIVTWNVNGLRSLKQHPEWKTSGGYKSILDSLNADIICFQETKAARDKLDLELAFVDGYEVIFCGPKVKKGYSGVATYFRSEPIFIPVACEEGFSGRLSDTVVSRCKDRRVIGFYDELSSEFGPSELRELDSEGRCVITDHGAFVLLNVYFPNESGPERLAFKLQFYRAIEARVRQLLRANRHVIVVGDVNCCHERIDHCEYVSDGTAGGGSDFESRPARQWLHAFLVQGGGPMVDAFRALHPTTTGAYTCWSSVTNARLSNFGTRIDYILVSVDLFYAGAVASCDICPLVMGSDHCPVRIELCTDALQGLPREPHPPPFLCSRYMPEFTGTQQTLFTAMQRRPAARSPASACACPIATPTTQLQSEPPMRRLHCPGSPAGGLVPSNAVSEAPSGAAAGEACCYTVRHTGAGRTAASAVTRTLIVLDGDDSTDSADAQFAPASPSVPPSAVDYSSPAPSLHPAVPLLTEAATVSGTTPTPREPPQVPLSRKRTRSSACLGRPGTSTASRVRHQQSLLSFFRSPSPPPLQPQLCAPQPAHQSSVDSTAPPSAQIAGDKDAMRTLEAAQTVGDNDAVATEVAAVDSQGDQLADHGTVASTSSGAAVCGAAGAWNAILNGRSEVALCSGHKEPCILLRTNKSGKNHGRKFFLCARPIGDYKRNKHSRCPYFIWESDFITRRIRASLASASPGAPAGEPQS